MRQIRNEWRSNIWLGVELTVVSVAIWYMVASIITVWRVMNIPLGYDTENVFLLPRLNIPADSGEVDIPADSAARSQYFLDSRRSLIKSIASRPGVEKVGFGLNISMYNFDFMGNNLMGVDDPDSVVAYGNMRFASPEIAEILRFTPLAGGQTSADVAEALRRGELLVSRTVGRDGVLHDSEKDLFADGLPAAKNLIGRQARFLDNRVGSIGMVVEDTRRSRFEPAMAGNVILPASLDEPETMMPTSQILVRVKPGMASDFLEDFSRNPGAYRTGPFYVAEATSLDSMRDGQEREVRLKVRNTVAIMVFLLVSIFLGLLGTFWSRTSSRVSEIAVRKSVGASSADIFRRLVSEGLMILSIASLPAVVIDWAIARYLSDDWWSIDSLLPGGAWGNLVLCVLIAFVAMAVMTVAGIWFPARKAMRLDPATALRDE